MRSISLFLLFVGMGTGALAQSAYPNLRYDAELWKDIPPVVLTYLNENLPAASAAARQMNFPVDLLLCVAALESGWGRSELTLMANNHFGIKNPYEDGPSYCMMHMDYVEGKGRVMAYTCFKSYDSAYESFLDYIEHLQVRACYLDIMTYDQPSFDDWVEVIAGCGYATDPQYAAKLRRIRAQYHFDFLIGEAWR